MTQVPRRIDGSEFDPWFVNSNRIFNPLFDSGNLQSGILNPFENFLRSPSDQASPSLDKGLMISPSAVYTRVDWVETPSFHVFKADLPGMKKDDIRVEVVDDRVLSISGERTKEKVDERHAYRQEERSYGKFSRQFPLPPNTKHHDISAKLENGVLTVTVPKDSGIMKIRTVEIQGYGI
ncbi:hypothetical protein R1flu_001582 [Riccia fluitans]|uniref:SHSP domain-containing protein n=1 Tax=Riccia fluitans TaxID=41844 RepID=A0ABD1Y6Z7_9MARC